MENMQKCGVCKNMGECKEQCLCGKGGCLCGRDIAMLLIRLALAVVFIYHGWQKGSNIQMTVGFFAKLGFAPFLAYLVAAVEFFGGIAMLLGIFVKYAGALLAIVMLVAIVKVKILTFHTPFASPTGGYEFDLVLLLTALAVVMGGAGKYALIKPKMCCQNCDKK